MSRNVRRKLEMDPMSSSSSSSAAAAADEESKQILGGAVYYNKPRLSIPRLANDYVAIRKTIYYPNGVNPLINNGFLRVPYGADINQILAFEPYISTGAFTSTAGTLSNSLMLYYDEFRVRGLKVELVPVFNPSIGTQYVQGANNDPPSQLNWLNRSAFPSYEAFMWYPSNHHEIDIDTLPTEMPDYLSLRNAKNAGEKIVKVASERSTPLATTYVPQYVDVGDTIGGVAAVKDIQTPWMLNAIDRRAQLLRAPIFLFRRPFMENPNVGNPPETSPDYAVYKVLIHCVLEFRNMDINKI